MKAGRARRLIERGAAASTDCFDSPGGVIAGLDPAIHPGGTRGASPRSPGAGGLVREFHILKGASIITIAIISIMACAE
jgi:hypothetical protein